MNDYTQIFQIAGGVLISIISYFLKGVVQDVKWLKREQSRLQTDLSLLKSEHVMKHDVINDKFDDINQNFNDLKESIKELTKTITLLNLEFARASKKKEE